MLCPFFLNTMALFQPIKVPKDMKNDRPVEELLLSWPDSYYNEQDPKMRRRMLDAAIGQGLSPKEDEVRDAIFQIRHPDGTKPMSNGAVRDAYMGVWLNLHLIKDSLSSRISRRGNVKRAKEALAILKEDEIRERFGQLGADLLYHEVVHLAKVYMTLCNEDKQYTSIILGFGRMKEDRIIGKISEDAYTVARAIPEGLGMTSEFALWTKAVTDAYHELFPDSNYFEMKESGE